MHTQTNKHTLYRPVALTGALLGPKAVTRLLDQALTKLAFDPSLRHVSVNGTGLLKRWSIMVGRDGSGVLIFDPEGECPTAKDMEPTRLALSMSPRIGKLIETEIGPVLTYIRFTLCPKGQEVSRCRFCGTVVTLGDRICGPCNDEKYGTHRFGGEIPAGVDW